VLPVYIFMKDKTHVSLNLKLQLNTRKYVAVWNSCYAYTSLSYKILSIPFHDQCQWGQLGWLRSFFHKFLMYIKCENTTNTSLYWLTSTALDVLSSLFFAATTLPTGFWFFALFFPPFLPLFCCFCHTGFFTCKTIASSH